MENNPTSKKLTHVEGGETSASSASFVASDESKAKARNLRIIAILSWIVAIGFEIWAIKIGRAHV